LSRPARRAQVLARRVLRTIDRFSDVLVLSALATMVAIIAWQVFGRYVLQSSPRWSSELALVLLAWLGFLGIAIGSREHSHIAVTFVADRLPRRIRSVVARLAPLLFLLFGVYLVAQGWSFTRLSMNSTLPSTGLSTAVQYAAMPVSGVLISVYSLLQLLGVDTRRAPDDGGADGAGMGVSS
jgi:TRAP-type C4-dicarboxylate transport system permease small subunit